MEPHFVAAVDSTPFSNAASRFADAMLSPCCEREGAEAGPQRCRPLARGLLRREVFSEVANMGSLAVAPARGRGELVRFAERTEGHRLLDAEELGPAGAGSGRRPQWPSRSTRSAAWAQMSSSAIRHLARSGMRAL